MGDAADDILTGLSLTEEERKVYNTVKTKLEQHFVKKRNVIFERAKFNSLVQPTTAMFTYTCQLDK